MNPTSRAFAKLKRNRKLDFERLRRNTGFNLGTQKRTRLKHSLGRPCTTLLEKDVANKYADMLQTEMRQHWDRRSKDAEQERLRFLTVLDCAEPLDVGYVVQAGRKLAKRIHAALEEQGVWSIGTIEVELVNRARLQQAAASQKARNHPMRKVLRIRDESSRAPTIEHVDVDDGDENARRKHTVIESIIAPLDRHDSGTFALIHFHGLVDLGYCASRNGKHEAVVRQLRKIWTDNFRVDLKATFRDQAIGKKLNTIAQYITKGGNEALRYKDKFGREEIEGRIWRQGMGRADTGGETVQDEHALTIGEIRDLDAIYGKLMGKDGDGFIVRVARQKRWKKPSQKIHKRR